MNKKNTIKSYLKLSTIALMVLTHHSCFLFSFDSPDDYIEIYKFEKVNYSKHVPVELSDDKTKITSSAGPLPTHWPVELTNGYYLNGTLGKNSGYISMTIEDYNESHTKIGIDSLNKLIIERDPYLEFYRGDLDNFWVEEGGYYGIDTAAINNIIKRGKRDNYFDKLK